MVEPNRLTGAATPNAISGPPAADARSWPNGLSEDPQVDLDEPDHDLELEDLTHEELLAYARVLESEDSAPVAQSARADGLRADAPRDAQLRRVRGRGRRGFLVGLAIAAVGVPLFFGDGLLSEELGIALICLGLGAGLISILVASARADVAESRRSLTVAIATTAFLPHTALVWLAALGLVAFGLLMLLVAARIV